MLDLIQGTEEWLRYRAGRATASRVADIIARTKTGWGASRANYAAQLVAERLTGVPAETFTNAAMAWGTATEPEACRAYAFYADADLTEIGFVDHPKIAMAGASPDRLVGSDGLLEVKCPQTATHIATLLGGAIPEKYRTQIQWQLACMPERSWADFASYDPRLPESMRLFVQRVERDGEAIAGMEAHVIDFLGEVDETVAQLRARYEQQQKAA
jgi:putative phage-type endonuclease